MSDIGRASTTLAVGTILSRLTGIVRQIVLVVAIGSVGTRAGDAFAVANQLPNNIYVIISYGLLTAVIVPQIVKASTAADGGDAFISKLMTLAGVLLLGITAGAMIGAPWLVSLYADNFAPDQIALAIAFAYWCLPQIFFYGMYAFLGETLNARRIFGPFTWAPIVNNIVSIAGLGVLIALFGTDLRLVSDWTPDAIALLGGTFTLGIAVQAAVLLLFWRRARLRLRLDFRWRGVGLGDIGKLAGWTFLMVILGQILGVVQTRVAGLASGEGASVLTMQNAWLLFMLPFSIIVLSIGTPYFTQISEHATAGRDDEVRRDISTSIRTLGFLMVMATAGLAAAAFPASRIFTNSAADAEAAGYVLLAYLVGLIPLSVLFIIQRTFYAYGDTRTPFLFTLFQFVLVLGGTVLVGEAAGAGMIPVTTVAVAIALTQSVGTILQLGLATWLLRRRLGRLELRSWAPALVRFIVAAVPAGAVGGVSYALMGGHGGWMTANQLLGGVGTGVICFIVLAVYVAVMALLRAPELKVAVGVLTRILRP